MSISARPSTSCPANAADRPRRPSSRTISASASKHVLEALEAGGAYRAATLDDAVGRRRHIVGKALPFATRTGAGGRRRPAAGAKLLVEPSRSRAQHRRAPVLRGSQPERDRRAGRCQPGPRVATAAQQPRGAATGGRRPHRVTPGGRGRSGLAGRPGAFSPRGSASVVRGHVEHAGDGEAGIDDPELNATSVQLLSTRQQQHADQTSRGTSPRWRRSARFRAPAPPTGPIRWSPNPRCSGRARLGASSGPYECRGRPSPRRTDAPLPPPCRP